MVLIQPRLSKGELAAFARCDCEKVVKPKDRKNLTDGELFLKPKARRYDGKNCWCEHPGMSPDIEKILRCQRRTESLIKSSAQFGPDDHEDKKRSVVEIMPCLKQQQITSELPNVPGAISQAELVIEDAAHFNQEACPYCEPVQRPEL